MCMHVCAHACMYAHTHARTILREKKALLHKLAAALVERETLTGDEVRTHTLTTYASACGR